MELASSTQKTELPSWLLSLRDEDRAKGVHPVGGVHASLSGAIICLILLRLIDLKEAEHEAIAVFEDSDYHALFPNALQWHELFHVDDAEGLKQRLEDLSNFIKQKSICGVDHPLSFFLPILTAPLQVLLRTSPDRLRILFGWVNELSLDQSAERRAVLNIFDSVFAEIPGAGHGEYSSSREIADLMASLARPQPGDRIYDPCFGSGNLLLAAWNQVQESVKAQEHFGEPAEICGVEINEAVFSLGLTRLLISGVEEPHLESGNCLGRETLNSPIREGFDVVLSNPPMGGKIDPSLYKHSQYSFVTSDSTGLFVQHAISQLKPNGRAVVVVPEGFLFRGGKEKELRRHLVEQGFLDAIVSLPQGVLAPTTNVRTCLLVLGRNMTSRGVRMADAAPLFERRGGREPVTIRSALAHQFAQVVRKADLPEPRDLPDGVAEGTPGTGVLSRSVWEVSAEELEAVDWDLTPRRREKGGLEDILDGLKQSIGGDKAIVALSDVAEIISGRSIKSSELLDTPPDQFATPYLRIKDLRNGKVAQASSWLGGATKELDGGALLQGDVLLSKSGTIGKSALVDKNFEGSIAASGLYILRVDQSRIDPGFLHAYLASPGCRSWLNSQSRGATIQHLSRKALDKLPVPVPSLSIQLSATREYLEEDTDVLEFLGNAGGIEEKERFASWLAKLDQIVPKSFSSGEGIPELDKFAIIGEAVTEALGWLTQDKNEEVFTSWLMSLAEATNALTDVGQIPRGPGLLSVLQDAERNVLRANDRVSGRTAAARQARDILLRISKWLRAYSLSLFDDTRLEITGAPDQLKAGSFVEFSVQIHNRGVLPLRNVRIYSEPDWGVQEAKYLPEGGAFSITLSGEVPKTIGEFRLKLEWLADTLSSQGLEGDIELTLRSIEVEDLLKVAARKFTGSPYVTGSPLEPDHGHSVFFGRSDLIEKISRQISTHGNVVLLEGNRRAGKTSILKHLEGTKAIPGWLAIYASLQAAEGSSQAVGVPTAQVFRVVAISLCKALTKLDIDVPLPNGSFIAAGKKPLGVSRACQDGIGEETPFIDFRDYLEVVLDTIEPLGIGIVLMLDEFDKLQEGIDSGVTSPQVPENIRFLIQEYSRFSAILTGSRRLKRVSVR